MTSVSNILYCSACRLCPLHICTGKNRPRLSANDSLPESQGACQYGCGTGKEAPVVAAVAQTANADAGHDSHSCILCEHSLFGDMAGVLYQKS